MLRMTDTPFEPFIPYFTNASVPVAFLVPTPTGYGKSIMDATFSIRTLLKNNHIHDYEQQGQGPDNKKLVDGYFVNYDSLTRTTVSMYRPYTKHGDPRIWFSGLKKYCLPCNLLAIFSVGERLFIANLSNHDIASGLYNNGFLAELIQQAENQAEAIAYELRRRIQEIHNRGFLPTITSGDPGVGDTLENALGIARNNNKTPDYRGIELKASRTKLSGTENRKTLFTQVPKWDTPYGLTEKQILDTYGYWRPTKTGEERFQLHCTLSSNNINPQGLFLSVENHSTALCVRHQEEPCPRFVTLWDMELLRTRLLEKHPATFWVKATTCFINNVEHFRYDHITYTRNPNIQIFADLLDSGIITVDFLMNQKENGSVRNHGYPFKIAPSNIEMLFPRPLEYNLSD